MIIDFHTHLGRKKSKGLKRAVREARVDRAVLFPLESEDPEYEEFNKRVLKLSKEDDSFIPFMRLRPSVNVRDFVEEGVSEGFKGIKYHAKNDISLHGFRKILTQAEGFNLPVLFHSNKSIMKRFTPLIREYPSVKLIAAHGTAYEPYFTLYKECSNLFFDTSIKMSALSMKRLAEVDDTRLLLGSDYPFSTPLIERKRIELTPGDYLSDESKRLILGVNAENLLNI